MAGAIDRDAAIAKRYGIARSARWPAVERAHLETQPHCVACSERQRKPGTTQVHHVYPFHICVALGRADLELDPRNLMTLCERRGGRGEDHHLLIGHLDDFESFNPGVRMEAAHEFHGWTAARLRTSKDWVARVATRAPHFDAMSDEERSKLRARLDQLFPQDHDERRSAAQRAIVASARTRSKGSSEDARASTMEATPSGRARDQRRSRS